MIELRALTTDERQEQLNSANLAQQASPRISSSKFVFFACFDGTNNDRDDISVANDHIMTNIGAIAKMGELNSSDNFRTKYYPGVGTADTYWGSAIVPTAQINKTANAAYFDFRDAAIEWLGRKTATITSDFNYASLFSTAITGFSRGCAAAVKFSQLLYEKGLVNDNGVVLVKPGELSVDAMCLLDPVTTGYSDSLAIPENVVRENFVALKARDELRSYFRSTDFNVGREIYFHGNHCDIGGSYVNETSGPYTLSGLGAISFEAQVNFFKNAGLVLGDIPVERQFDDSDRLNIHTEGVDSYGNIRWTEDGALGYTRLTVSAFTPPDWSHAAAFIYRAGSGPLTYAPELAGQTLAVIDVPNVAMKAYRVHNDLFLQFNATDSATFKDWYTAWPNEKPIKNILFNNADFLVDVNFSDAPLLVRGTDANDTLSREAYPVTEAIFEGGHGNDTITGGHGKDTYKYAAGDGSDTIYAHVTGDGPKDILILKDIKFQDITTDITIQGYDLIIKVGADQITVKDWHLSLDNQIASVQFADETFNALEMTKLSKAIRGDANSNDFRSYNSPGLAMYGYDGADRLLSDNGADILIGGKGDDTLSSGIGADKLYGNAGVDTLYGGADDDILDGGTDVDFLSGGSGADTYIHRAGDGGDYIDAFSIHDGTKDSLKFVDLNAKDIRISHMGNDLYLSYADTQITVKNWYMGADYQLKDIQFTDGTKFDTAQIAELGRRIFCSDSGNYVNGTPGVENIIYGGRLRDVLYGAEKNDVIYGGLGGDALQGGAGNDTLVGGGGGSGGSYDTYMGNSGADTYIYKAGDGYADIDAYTKGEGAVDVLRLEGINYQDVKISHSIRDLIIEYGPSRIKIASWFYGSDYQLASVQFDNGTFNNAMLNLMGSVAYGGANGANPTNAIPGQTNIIFSQGGTVAGGTGNEMLIGTTADTSFYGGDGIDVGVGGTGRDYFSGIELVLVNRGMGLDSVTPVTTGPTIISMGNFALADFTIWDKNNLEVQLEAGPDRLALTKNLTQDCILQMVGTDATGHTRVEWYDLRAIINAFNSQKAVTHASLSDLAMLNGKGSSQTMAYGGELAINYALHGTIDLTAEHMATVHAEIIGATQLQVF